MLIACGACQRQYDVGSHPAGAVIRCLCGAAITVPEPSVRDARMIHCASCGAGLPERATECGFCHTAVALGSKGLGDACPGCFSRLVVGARFCNSCGIPIQPIAALKALSDRHCPRCKATLSECTSGDARFVECTGCGGLWLDEETVTQITERRARDATPLFLAQRERPPVASRDPSEDLRKVVYLACPVCREPMHRRNFARSSGVIVDWCRGHGYWFDLDELESVLAFIDSGGIDRQRERDKEALEAERRRIEASRRSGAQYSPMMFDPPSKPANVDLLSVLGSWLTRMLS